MYIWTNCVKIVSKFRNSQDSHKNQYPLSWIGFYETTIHWQMWIKFAALVIYFTIGKTNREDQHDHPIHGLMGLFGTSLFVSVS